MITRGIREFLARDWQAVRDSKDAYWGARVARLGGAEGFRIAEELRQQAILCDPEWPSETLRREDLAAHVRLSNLLRRGSAARRA